MKRLTAILALAMISFVVSCGNHEGRAHLELEERQNWDGAELYGDIANIVETSYELAGSYGRTVKTELISKKYVERPIAKPPIMLSQGFTLKQRSIRKKPKK